MKKKIQMKKPDIPMLVEILETLGEQGFIDVEPTEREYDLTAIYNFLVTSGIAIVPQHSTRTGKYWLQLLNEDACVMLTDLLKETVPLDIEAHVNEYAEKLGVCDRIEAEVNRLYLPSLEKGFFEFGKDVFVAELEDRLVLEVRSKCAHTLLGIKFLSGDAYGHYRIYEGAFVNPLIDFTRSQSKREVSIALMPSLTPFIEDQTMSIRRLQGKGKMTIALIGWSARPKPYESALKEVIR